MIWLCVQCVIQELLGRHMGLVLALLTCSWKSIPLMYAFLCKILMLVGHTSKVKKDRAALVYALMTSIPINVGKLIFSQLSLSFHNSNVALYFPTIITEFYAAAGVVFQYNDERLQPMKPLDDASWKPKHEKCQAHFPVMLYQEKDRAPSTASLKASLSSHWIQSWWIVRLDRLSESVPGGHLHLSDFYRCTDTRDGYTDGSWPADLSFAPIWILASVLSPVRRTIRAWSWRCTTRSWREGFTRGFSFFFYIFACLI